jgi:hypothetical protein
MERTVIFSIHNTLILQTSVGHRVQKEPLSLDFWFLRPRIHKHSTDSFTPKYSAYQGNITQIILTHQLDSSHPPIKNPNSKTSPGYCVQKDPLSLKFRFPIPGLYMPASTNSFTRNYSLLRKPLLKFLVPPTGQ